MSKTIALIITLAFATLAPAHDDTVKKTDAAPPTQAESKLAIVSVSSNGLDVRTVLHDMFKQVGKSYVVEPNVDFRLHLSLEKIEFEEALRLVCGMASLQVDVQNGIYFISKTKKLNGGTAVKGAFEAKPPVSMKLPESVLTRRVTTHLDKVDLRALMANLTKQTQVVFEVADNVPAYKLDAYMEGMTLKEALTTICTAAKLQYKFTNTRSIEISRAEPVNRVSVVGTQNP